MKEREVIVTEEMLQRQSEVRQVVAGLRDETPSMAWRSELNLKLLAASDAKQKKHRTRRWTAWGSSFGATAALACAATFVFLGSPKGAEPRSGAASSSMTRELLEVHQESAILASVSAAGPGARESDIVFDPLDYGDVL